MRQPGRRHISRHILTPHFTDAEAEAQRHLGSSRLVLWLGRTPFKGGGARARGLLRKLLP